MLMVNNWLPVLVPDIDAAKHPVSEGQHSPGSFEQMVTRGRHHRAIRRVIRYLWSYRRSAL